MSPMSAVHKPLTKSINQHFTIFFLHKAKKGQPGATGEI